MIEELSIDRRHTCLFCSILSVFAMQPPVAALTERRKIRVSLEHLETRGDELLCRSCVMKFSKQLDYDLHLQSEGHQQVWRIIYYAKTSSWNILQLFQSWHNMIAFQVLIKSSCIWNYTYIFRYNVFLLYVRTRSMLFSFISIPHNTSLPHFYMASWQVIGYNDK